MNKMVSFNKQNNNKTDGRSPNERFYESGGVTPQKKQCVIASASPAASAVAPAFIKPLTR